jgi:hypothetical protein
MTQDAEPEAPAAKAEEAAPKAAEKPADATTAKADGASFVQRPNKDIGRDGYDKDVYHFVREDTNVQPTPWPRRQEPYDPNGSNPKAQPSSFLGRTNRDIGEGGINEEVHGFASANNMVLPIPHARRDTPYEYNGGKTFPAQFQGVRFYRPQANKDIGEGGIDEEVHGFASANNMVLPIPHARRDSPYEYNGYKNQYPAFTANANRDIGEKGLDEEVHGFASANNMVLPIPHARRDSPYEYNGFKNQYPAGFVANANRDIGEGGIDEEVHGFASANNMVLPIPHARRDSPYEYNGFKNQYPASFMTNGNRDIGEGNIDKEVQEFASSNNMVQPIPNARRDSAYEYNGYKNQYPAGFTATKDIGEGGIDEEVHGFASANNMVLGIPHARRDTPYEYNGYKNQYPASFMVSAPKAKKVKDIGEKNIDEEVHGFVSANNMVEGTPLRRRQVAYAPNGSDPSAQPSDFVFRPTKLKDIGEKNIDEEVHGFVEANNMVEGNPLRRR